jgi:hypothetical protein
LGVTLPAKGEEEKNKALHLTAIPLRSIAAGELCRYTSFLSVISKVEG